MLKIHYVLVSSFHFLIFLWKIFPSGKDLHLKTHPNRRQDPNIAAGDDAVLPEIVRRTLRDFVVVNILDIEIND